MEKITNSPSKIIQNAEAFNSSWKSLLEDLLAFGKSSGADFIEIFLENTDHIGVLAEQDAITSVNPSFGKGAGIRVFLDKRDGFWGIEFIKKW